MKKTFRIIHLGKSKHQLFILTAEDAELHLTFCYNEISSTWMGTKVESFTENVRAFLRECPAFFEEFDGINPKAELIALGFEERAATEKERIFGFL